MGDGYRRITLAEGEEISLSLVQGLSYRTIARRLGRSPSTISRECARNGSGDDYRATLAEQRCRRRRRHRRRKLSADPRLRRYVPRGLRKQWSPQQISASLVKSYPEEPGMQSHRVYLCILQLTRCCGIS